MLFIETLKLSFIEELQKLLSTENREYVKNNEPK